MMEVTIEHIRKCKQLSKKERDWMNKHPENKDFSYTGPFTVWERNEEPMPRLTSDDLTDQM